MIKQYIKGDVRDTHIKNIAHGVNCQNKMGSGVAKALFERWPQVKERYHEVARHYIGDERILGDICVASCGEKSVYNLFTQLNYGYDGKKYVSYYAICKAFKFLTESGVKEVAIPKIGCGLAGGDWDIVKELINEVTGDDLDVYVYEL